MSFTFTHQPAIPEHCGMQFSTSGLQGGDSGHGGYAVLTISQPDGGTDLIVQTEITSTQHDITETTQVNVSVGGDWEIIGLVSAIVNTANAIMNDADMQKIYAAGQF